MTLLILVLVLAAFVAWKFRRFLLFSVVAVAVLLMRLRRGLGVPRLRLAGVAAAYRFTRLARHLREEAKDEATEMYRNYQASGGARARRFLKVSPNDDPPQDGPGWLIEGGRQATAQRRQH